MISFSITSPQDMIGLPIQAYAQAFVFSLISQSNLRRFSQFWTSLHPKRGKKEPKAGKNSKSMDL